MPEIKSAKKTKEKPSENEFIAPAQDGVLYELYMVVDPADADGETTNAEAQAKKVIEAEGGKIKKTNKLSKSSLAYPIQKHLSAYTGSIFFEVDGEKIQEIQDELRTSDINFLRLMVAKTSANALSSAKRPQKRQKVDMKAFEKEVEKLEKQDTAVEKPETKPEQKKEAEPKKEEVEKKDKISVEDIDKKLDEIMGEL